MSTLIQEAVLEEKQPDLDFFLDNNAERKKKESKKKDAWNHTTWQGEKEETIYPTYLIQVLEKKNFKYNFCFWN